MLNDFLLIPGTANPALAATVAGELGLATMPCTYERFPDGEISVQLDQSVRGRRAILLQPTAPPVNDHLVELLATIDACRRAAATSVTTIVPYMGYARSDKRDGRSPIMASLVAALLATAGADHVVGIDMHTPQLEGFFHHLVDNLTAIPVLCAALRPQLLPDTVIVSPDAGRVKMATRYADLLGLSLAVLHKQRISGSETRVTHVVGDVRDRPCLIIDDMIATAGTLAESIEALLGAGAQPAITIAATHGLLIGPARQRLSHPAVRAVLITDTIAQPAQPDWPQLQIVSVAPLLAQAIRQLASGSLSALR